jgi:hypothetical protein
MEPAFEFGVEARMIAANPMERMDAPPRAIGTPKVYHLSSSKSCW